MSDNHANFSSQTEPQYWQMFISVGFMLQLCFKFPAVHVISEQTFHTREYFDLVKPRVNDKRWNKKHAKNERTKIN